MSRASRRKGPASSATDRLPPSSSPSGMPRLADCNALRRSTTVTPAPARRAGSISIRTARPGPPMVATSRVPGTRFRSASTLCATRSRSKASLLPVLSNSVSVTIGTSSMLRGLISGSPTPRPRGSQSAFALTVSYRRTSASVRATPTLNCTVITASPGRESDITCSTPAICDSTCSAGVATICSTSRTEAPGKGTSTLAIVRSICGSSSRGATITAKAPSSSATSASRGVIRADWKKAAIRPETPSEAFIVRFRRAARPSPDRAPRARRPTRPSALQPYRPAGVRAAPGASSARPSGPST